MSKKGVTTKGHLEKRPLRQIVDSKSVISISIFWSDFEKQTK